jgi:hypothetical protein
MSGDTDLTARQGVEAVRAAITAELEWYPREPAAPDYGIDLYVECADAGVPNGRMLALQIKSGTSYLAEREGESWVFRGDQRHLRYWLAHSLPVVLVLHDPEGKATYWQALNEQTVTSTGKGWKALVPADQRLDAKSAPVLRELAAGDPYVLVLNRLLADRSWMTLLQDGGTLHLEAEEWVNKRSGRGDLRLIGVPGGGNETIEQQYTIYVGLTPYSALLPALFPWADLEPDQDLYYMHDEAAWDLETGAWGSEEHRYIMHSEPFGEWLGSPATRSTSPIRGRWRDRLLAPSADTQRTRHRISGSR